MEATIRPHHLFVLVSDVQRARAFYVDVLGLDVLVEEPGYLRVGGEGGFHIGIEEGAGEAVGGTGIEIAFEVDDVDRRHQELTAKGLVFTDPPADMPWGARHAWFADPDGYRMSIFSATE